MDVTSFIGAITGGNNVKMDIQIHAIPDMTKCILLDHTPSWKLHKNPFWRIKNQQQQLVLNQNIINQSTAPLPQQQSSSMTMPPQQQLPPLQQQPYPNTMYRNQYDSPYPPSLPQQQNQNQPQYDPNNNMNGHQDVLYAFEASQDIEGMISIRLLSGTTKGQEHLGVKVMLIGRIDLSISGMTIDTTGSGKSKYDFVSISKELIPPGTLYQSETMIPFKFKGVDKEFDSYYGRNVAVRYFIRVTMERKFLPMIKFEKDIWIQSISTEPTYHEPIKMEVGIEDCLHIEFEYSKKTYHVHDTIYGKIHFLLVRIKIKHMELAVIRRETSGGDIGQLTNHPSGGGDSVQTSLQQNSSNAGNQQSVYTETQTLIKYEIMDGGPVKGEIIPVKLSLRGIPADLTPTYRNVNNRFSVRYYLNLVLVDDDDRRYFKQQEIFLYRHVLGS